MLPRPALASLVGSLMALSLWPIRTLAQGSVFGVQEVDLSRFMLVAAPIGSGERYQLNIYEQRSDKRPCFASSGANPEIVDPLLASFNFSGICNRYIDGNGYSLRIGGSDYGTRYRLSVVRRGGDMQLLAVPSGSAGTAEALVARTGGQAPGFLRLVMEPGWRLMRRTYGERALGHIYVYRDAWPDAAAAATVPVVPPEPGAPNGAPEAADALEVDPVDGDAGEDAL